jgi:hypothetical protein
MAGADLRMRKLLKEFDLLSDYQRGLKLQQLADDYGQGFANAVRAEFDKRRAQNAEKAR